MMHLSKEKAEEFYSEHAKRPFYKSLVDYMTSGPVVVQVLAADNAVDKYREINGLD